MSIAEDAEVNYEERRKVQRQTVLLKASVTISGFAFEALIYDMSLYGARVKLDLPLQKDTILVVNIKDKGHIPARVAWVGNGFMGLEFKYTPTQVKSTLGSLGDKLG